MDRSQLMRLDINILYLKTTCKCQQQSSGQLFYLSHVLGKGENAPQQNGGQRPLGRDLCAWPWKCDVVSCFRGESREEGSQQSWDLC